jgi:hypothetical protein
MPKQPAKKPGTKKPKQTFEGEGLFDVFTPRDHYNNTSRRTLEAFGDATITGITLSRAPIPSFFRKVINTISFGKFEEALKRYGYDRIFHLSMLVDVEKAGVHRRIVIEKNAVININTAIRNEPDAEYLRIPVTMPVTLSTLMNKTQALMGNMFFPYDAFHNNCQDFIKSILQANGLLNQSALSWLYQNMSEVRKEISGVTRAITNGITHVGAVADRILGNGKPERTELEAFIDELLAGL